MDIKGRVREIINQSLENIDRTVGDDNVKKEMKNLQHQLDMLIDDRNCFNID